jgi:hypothetical protein
MLDRLRVHWLDVPLVWPGTHDQAMTIVHALTDESLNDTEREHLVEIVQASARRTWRGMVGSSEIPTLGVA